MVSDKLFIMDIQAWKPINELASVRERIEKLASANAWNPPADWFETDDDLILVMDVPGVEPSSLEIAHDGDTVTLAGMRATQEYGQPRSQERPRGSFQRTLRVPEAIEPGSAVAQYRAGQLEVRFHKMARTITIEPG